MSEHFQHFIIRMNYSLSFYLHKIGNQIVIYIWVEQRSNWFFYNVCVYVCFLENAFRVSRKAPEVTSVNALERKRTLAR